MARDEPLEQRLLALFLDELDENVGVLNRGLVALETRADDSAVPHLLAELFRAAHSLKGAAHSAGVRAAVIVSDRLEQRLGEMRDGTLEAGPSILSELFAGVDELAAEGARIRRGDDGATAAPADAVEVHTPTARVAARKLDELLDQAANLKVSALRLATLAAEGGADTRRIDTAARRLALDTNRVVAAAHDLRMQPFGQVCEGLDRTVRDLASDAGKEVRFSLTGAEMELDRAVGTLLREPVLHLLRNAVDHGIEAPEHRRRVGKPPSGHIQIAASVSDAGVEVTVSDDGAGVDVAALRQAADRQARPAAPEDSLELAFEAGLSTAETVTAVSGRGVGLDAVRTRIENLGGGIDLTSESGLGTRVVLKLPRTLSILRGLQVAVSGEVVTLPLTAVARLLRIRADEIREAEGKTFVLIAGEAVPVVPLAAVLGLSVDEREDDDDAELLAGVVVQTGGRQTVLVVDALLDESEVLVKALPARAMGSVGVLGATLLADGRPSLVVSPAACVRAAASIDARYTPRPPTPEASAPRVLLVEDSVTTRVLEQSILEAAGYEVMVAVDGAEAWRVLQERGADVVVTDVNMPEMDGHALCAAIRGSPRFERLPVVFVTSLADEEDRRRGLESGADAYIVKSAFDQHALLNTIEQLL